MTQRLLGRRASLALAVSMLALVLATPLAQAQSLARAQIMVLITVPPVLLVDTESSQVIVTENQIRAGQQADGSFLVEKGRAILLRTTANVPHSLWVSAGDDVFSGDSGTIPVSRLQWRRQGSDWIPLSTELQLVRESMDPSQEELDVDLRLVLELTDPPGSYEGEILFTLQHPVV